LVGATSAAQVVNDATGECVLTIFVMSADDVSFKAGISESLINKLDEPTNTMYNKLAQGEDSPPKLALVFPPYLIYNYSGDAFVRTLTKIMPKTPLFGTIATDDTALFNESETIFNGVTSKDAMTCVLCYGNIKPKFLIATLPKDDAISLKAKVTKARDNIVYEINNITALDFFRSTSIPDGLVIIPFLIDVMDNERDDGVQVTRGRAAFTEDGAAIFSGNVAEGASMSLLRFSHNDIISSAQKGMHRLNMLSNVNGALLFPCIVSRMALLSSEKSKDALNIVKETINPKLPFMLGYSGGEICPTSTKNDIPVNRFHNYTVIILAV
jgi:hypothetical protein